MTRYLACEQVVSIDDVADFGCGCDIDFQDEGDIAKVEGVIDAATDMLVRLSGFRWSGVCQDTLRPCRSCCSCDHVCGSCTYDRITLKTPVVAIQSIRVDGEVLSGSDYKLVNGNQLIRVDESNWPGCQDIRLDSTEEHTFEIIYNHGFFPTVIEIEAGKELICEMLHACFPSGRRSQIPGARSLSGAGVNVTVDQRQVLDAGLASVQRFVNLWNPAHDKVAPRVFSPELDDNWEMYRTS